MRNLMLMYCDLWPKIPKLNSRLVYCSRLFGTLFVHARHNIFPYILSNNLGYIFKLDFLHLDQSAPFSHRAVKPRRKNRSQTPNGSFPCSKLSIFCHSNTQIGYAAAHCRKKGRETNHWKLFFCCIHSTYIAHWV